MAGDHHDYLSEDVLASDILVRLPVESLLRFRSVCKSWHAIISSPHFIDSHMQRAKKISPRLLIMHVSPIDNREINLYTYNREGRSKVARHLCSKTLPRPLDISWPPPHANGLLLLSTNYASRLFVCNPSTRENILLPHGRHNLRVFSDGVFNDSRIRAGFGFVPSINAYKVAQYFYTSYGNDFGVYWSMGFEVFTLGIDSSWREIKELLPYSLDGTTTTVGKSVYFRIDRSLHPASSPEAFVSFDLEDEEFRAICLPSDVGTVDGPSCRQMGFVDLDGDTYFVKLWQQNKKFDVWFVKDCTAEYEWTHMFSINLLRPALSIFPVTMQQGKLCLYVMDAFDDRLQFYNPQSMSIETAVDLGKDLAYYNPQSYKYSFISPKTIADDPLLETLGENNMFMSRNRAFVVIPHKESLVPVLSGKSK